MDRSTALQLAADEMEERELRSSRIEIVDYLPSDPSQGLLAPPGSVTVFVAYAEDPVLDRIRDAASGSSGLDVHLSLEIRDASRGIEKVSYYQAYRRLRGSDSFASIRYGCRTIATNIFPPPGSGLMVLDNPYNGGRLDPDELTLVEHRVPGTRSSLAALALRHVPPLTDAERVVIDQVPDDQLEMNLSMSGDCCDNLTDYAWQLLTHIQIMQPPKNEPVSFSEEEIERLGPAASARKLLNRRRELLGHTHS